MTDDCTGDDLQERIRTLEAELERADDLLELYQRENDTLRIWLLEEDFRKWQSAEERRAEIREWRSSFRAEAEDHKHYNSIVVSLGYFGSFSIWSYVSQHEGSSGLLGGACLIVSVTLFIATEIAVMIAKMLRVNEIEVRLTEELEPYLYYDERKIYNKVYKVLQLCWPVLFSISVIAGLVGAGATAVDAVSLTLQRN